MKIVSKKKLMLLMVVLLHTALKPAKRPSTSKRRSTGINAGALITAGTGALITTALIARTTDHWIRNKSAESINVPDSNGDTYLIRAARNNFPSVMKALLHYGAKVDAQNRDGNTALFSASEHPSAEAAMVLLEHKADVNIQNSYGETPLSLAWGVRRVFFKREMWRPNYSFFSHEGTDVVKLLLDHGANVDIEDNQGRTLFQRLMHRGEAPLTDGGYALVSNGAGTNDDFARLIPVCEAMWRMNMGGPNFLGRQAISNFYHGQQWDPSSRSKFDLLREQRIADKKKICAEQIDSINVGVEKPKCISDLIAGFLVNTSSTECTESAMLEAIDMFRDFEEPPRFLGITWTT